MGRGEKYGGREIKSGDTLHLFIILLHGASAVNCPHYRVYAKDRVKEGRQKEREDKT